MRFFWLRLKIACKIFFNLKSRWLFIEISNEQLQQLVSNEDFKITMHFHKLRKYLGRLLIQRVHISEDEMVLLKAEFEADYDQHLQEAIK